MIQNVAFQIARMRARRVAADPRTNGQARVREILASLDEIHEGMPGPEEAAWFSRIENLRRELLRSEQTVTVEDFGRGPQPETRIRTIGEICRSSSAPEVWGKVLFYLVRKLKPGRCLELGTCLGISAAYLGAACAVNRSGSVLTLEGSGALAGEAHARLKSIGLTNVRVMAGPFHNTLETSLKDAGKVDLAFIDGHHDGEAMIGYVEMIRPYLSGQGVMVLDDIFWSSGMHRAWREVSRNRGFLPVSLLRMGILANTRGTA